MIKWLQTLISLINAEEIQLGKDIPEVESNIEEEQSFFIDWSNLQ
jgi:hypothetical protein